MRAVYFVIILFAFGACKESSANKEAIKSGVSKEVLASELYQYYVANATSVQDKDNNTLIEYAVDNNLDCKKSPKGVFYTTDQEGTGELLKMGDPVAAHYKGYLLNGNVFDSSYDRGKPIQFNVGRMIPGWNEWLTLVNPGTKSTLLIPSSLAYGTRGFSDKIPANSPLIFEVEVLTK